MAAFDSPVAPGPIFYIGRDRPAKSGLKVDDAVALAREDGVGD